MKIKRKNKYHLKGWRYLLPLVVAPLICTSCIDEDLSDCGVDFAIDYRMQLSASLRMSLDEQLTTPAERELGEVLKSNLAYVLTDRAQVMDLSFFHKDGGSVAKHLEAEPDANTLAITVYMNKGEYHNIALAATGRVGQVNIDGASSYGTISLQQVAGDTIDSHEAALYMGHTDMSVSNVSENYYVPLYMQNSVPVLVVNTGNSQAKPLAAYTSGVASGFRCADSVFVYDRPAVVRTRRVETDALTAFYSVCFPSEDRPENRATSVTDDAAESLWKMELYVRTPDGKTVKNTLYVKDPLRAGEIQVIKVNLNDKGEAVAENPEVGISVELDWNSGNDFDVEM